MTQAHSMLKLPGRIARAPTSKASSSITDETARQSSANCCTEMCPFGRDGKDAGMFALFKIGPTGKPRARTQSSASDTKPMGTTLSVMISHSSATGKINHDFKMFFPSFAIPLHGMNMAWPPRQAAATAVEQLQ